jgi:L-amino acid N-acyltransferase YncA
MDFIIEAMRPDDWEAVRAIYAEGISTGLATFETQTPDWKAWDSAHLFVCRLAARVHAADGRGAMMAGWAALSPVSRRAAYRGVAEVSIYIAGWARGQGIGRALLNQLIADAEQAGFWTLQSSIFAENTASLALHRLCGFREVGRRERIAQRDGVWHDTVIMEWRSAVVGV